MTPFADFTLKTPLRRRKGGRTDVFSFMKGEINNQPQEVSE